MNKHEQIKFDFAKGLEEKLKMPSKFWDAWNSAKKVPSNSRKYQPGVDFAYANGTNAKGVLSSMFPNEAGEIKDLSASQAMKAYFDIREVYFG